jgi:UDP-glucuronate decarboxylase
MRMLNDSDIEEIYQNSYKSVEKLLGKQILITGAAGFLGRYFMAFFNLVNQRNPLNPINIVALDSYITSSNLEDQAWQKTSPEIEWIFGDASIGAQLPNKFDYIIHAAGIASPEHYRAHPLETIKVAVDVTRDLLEKAKNDKSRFLFFSSSEIYGDPFPEFIPTEESFRGHVSSRGPRACYDESKRMGEALCWIYENYYGVHACVVRPFNVYGPGMMPRDYRVLPNFATALFKGESLKVYGHGKQTRTFCYITDAICGFLKVLIETDKADVYNVGNPEPEINMIALAELFSRISGSPSGFELIKYPASYPEDEPNRRCPDINKIQRGLGYSPKVSLNEGLQRFISWSQSNYTDELTNE